MADMVTVTLPAGTRITVPAEQAERYKTADKRPRPASSSKK